MKDLTGNIKEDEREAFELICERTGVDPDEASGVGYMNRLAKLCGIAGLKMTFTVHDIPEAAAEVSPAEPEPGEDLRTSETTDDDNDPFED